MTQWQQKHREWQEDGRPVMGHGSVVRPTMYLASMDSETPVGVAKPKRIAQLVEDHDVHGWIIAALLREVGWP